MSMVLTVPIELRRELSHEPEYAMGYQIGRAKTPSGQIVRGYILNSSVFVSVADVSRADKDHNAMFLLNLGLLGSTIDLARTSVPSENQARVIDLEPRPLSSLKGVITIKAAELRNFSTRLEEALAGKTGAAKDAPITITGIGEIFKRFSHFKDDHRVTSGRGLTKGTFTTTAADALNVHTGMDAVHRYALPDKRPANKRFTISPPQRTSLQRGVAQPAYGESGGGIEVIFVDGSPDDTVTGPEVIPER